MGSLQRRSKQVAAVGPMPSAAGHRAHIDELCHRMTVANTTDVRMQLCAEAKQAITELVNSLMSRSEK